MEAEAAAPAVADDVCAARRIVDQPTYGGAAWAVIFGNGKFVGTAQGRACKPARRVRRGRARARDRAHARRAAAWQLLWSGFR
eukprot:6193213-Pleurochrysis_carterae.AAC.2